ncbi:MAG: hypothetical protein JWM71_2397 [Solirubrobacteraceae bacterium]|nr:hypothetical protein [Solirubrobacteraceae bacterium]
MSHRLRPLLVLTALLLVAAPAAHAADPGRWKLAQTDSLNIDYFQGLTHGPGGNVFFDGPAQGFYRTDTNLKQAAGVDDIYPADVGAIGFNHAGDPTYDPSEGGRLLAPMECYHPDLPQANTCGIGGFGVLDPTTLAWRYWVRLDQADIPKAMWAEVSPDGQLVWTSSGNDLLAYRTADITAANAATGADSPPIHPVQRLVGKVPPSGVTGGVFIGGRLFLAGEAGDVLQVQSVDLTGKTPTRTEIELPGVKAESEGLDLLDMRGGTLHWILSPFVDSPTYGTNHTELLTFLPAANARLALKAVRRGRGAVVTVTSVYAGKVHPVSGATVRVGAAKATTSAKGVARLTKVSSSKVAVRATKLALASGTLVLRKR